ncbi:hypothetical protein [Prosthecobacter vanneervenii]|uniref:Lipoprotein n=1 Tax=Prosthecobacter vanneervenii TaxID=48466 RepID=A0A7W8DLQ9_9BACT|nr:hypothetical protein [Prosthecobacter vanneervenii]MBB5034578.1 hypothetical protein [Prosthecobacter vanneervenii]
MKTSPLPLVAALALSACGKSEAPKTAAPAPAAKPAVSEAQLQSEISSALTPEPAKATGDEALKAEADEIISRHPGKTATELLNTPEVKDKLAAAMKKLAVDPVLMKRVNSTVELAAQVKGLEGAAKLDLDMKGYDRSRTSRMLQSVLSEQPGRIVDFLVSEIGEATPDISYGGLDRAPNGVAIVPNTLPAASTAPPSDPE